MITLVIKGIETRKRLSCCRSTSFLRQQIIVVKKKKKKNGPIEIREGQTFF